MRYPRWLDRRLGRDAEGAQARRARRPAMLGLIVFVLASLALARFATPWLDDALVGSALGPLAVVDAAQDDGAGDALTPLAEAELYLPVPSILDDERVVAAFGPIARLECHKDDAPADSEATRRRDALRAPLTGESANAESVDGRQLLAAAASPIAMLGTPAPPAEGNMMLAAVPPAPADATAAPAAGSCAALLRLTFNRLQTGKPESLCQFDGKVLLVVNTASYCGYTHQYEGLEAMYRKYKDRGLVVVGFPSNDFGKQEPGSNQEIAEFCRLTYGVEFPMFEKSSVTDLRSNPLFTELAARTGKAPQWNFHKYLVDRNGAPVASFTSQVEPTDRTLVALVERLLDDKPRKTR